MVEMGKVCDMPWSFTASKTELPCKIVNEQPIRLPTALLFPRVAVEQRTHYGDEQGRREPARALE